MVAALQQITSGQNDIRCESNQLSGTPTCPASARIDDIHENDRHNARARMGHSTATPPIDLDVHADLTN
jgi:hypothetical protein